MSSIPHPTAIPSAQNGLRIGHIWLLALLLLIWLFLALAPMPPNDLWWHMAAGRAMVAEGRVIGENRWAFTLPADAPYVYQSWLSELAMYWLWRLGDVPALVLARSAVIVGAFGLVALHAARRAGSARMAALALLLATLVSWNNWTLRPQTLALLPGAALLFVLGEYLDGRGSARRLALLPALMLVWVNAHGSFILGLGLAGLAWLGLLIEATLARDEAARERLLPLGLATAATALAGLASPLGVGVFGYVRGMIGNAALLRSFVEWQPTMPQGGLADTGPWFYTTLLLLALLLAHGRRRPSAVDLLWYGALAYLAISGVRYAMWFALALLPLLADRLAVVLPAGREPPLSRAGATALLGIGGLVCALSLPWFAPGRLLGNERIFASAGEHRWLLGASTPVAATEYLRGRPALRRGWVEMSLSSYTIWALPRLQVFADLRVELFPLAIWDEYFTIAAGRPEALALLDRRAVDVVLLDPGGQPALQTLLAGAPGWCETYRDRGAVVFERCGG